MIEESFAYGNSLLHRLDPRVRVLCATLYAFVTALLSRLPAMAGAFLFSLVLVVLCRLPMRQVLKRLALTNAVILLLWLVVPFTFGGEAAFGLGPLTASREGILVAVAITLKCNAIVMAFMGLIATMPMATIGQALENLRFPKKLVSMLLLTYRYVFVIEEEYRRMIRALKARGFRPGTTMHTYRTYAYLVGMLFVRASARAERVHQAMRCRGFSGRFFSLREFSLSWWDWVALYLLLCAIIGLGIVEWVIRVQS